MENYNSYKTFKDRLALLKSHMKKKECDKCILEFKIDGRVVRLENKYGWYGSSSSYNMNIFDNHDTLNESIVNYLNKNKDDFLIETEKFLLKKSSADLEKLKKQKTDIENKIKEIEKGSIKEDGYKDRPT